MQERQGIKAWAEDDRPREKLISGGRHTLSDAELLAIILGSGSREETALDLARRILAQGKHNLNELARLNVKELMRFKGVGEAKAVSVMAALELGRRRKDSEPEKRTHISCSRDIFSFMRPRFLDLPHEEFRVIFLNRAHQVLKEELISRGGIAGTVVDTRIIFKSALENLAVSIVLCHNHPSGNPRPSEADISLTRKIREAGKLLEIQLLDHLIFTDKGYCSFADEGMM